MPADILLDTNAIDLVDGDVAVEQNLTVDGNLTIDGGSTNKIEVKMNGVVRVRITSGGFTLFAPDGKATANIAGDTVKLYNSSGAMKVMLGSGSSMFYSDILLVTGADIKLDGEYLSSRLDNIEQRLTNGGL